MLINKKLFYVVLTALLVIIVVIGSGVLDAPRGGYPTVTRCEYNLRMLCIAMDKYREVYHSFPPSFTTDKSGKPMHSWRALILPYLDITSVRYNYEEPWDSPYNRKFHDKMPSVFCCPFTPKPMRKSTPSYAMITGKNTIGEGQDKIIRYSTTILLIEVKNANFNWLEPVDIPLEQLQFDYRKSKNTSNLIGSHHNDSDRIFSFVTCAGFSYTFSFKKNDVKLIKTMATIDGAQSVVEKNDEKTKERHFEFQDQKSEK
ncbi:MAG: DUF1559 domain-containing protein [Planctomycetaceae bacterium]|jgi:hypothetical protein|nr:DUF1559 domain-containing protein [Planctomycetaceae bacterium]